MRAVAHNKALAIDTDRDPEFEKLYAARGLDLPGVTISQEHVSASAPANKNRKKHRPARPPKSRSRDRRILEAMGLSPASGHPSASDATSVPTPPAKTRYPSHPSPCLSTSTRTKTKRDLADERDARRPPAYRNTTDLGKMAIIADRLAEIGFASNRTVHAFTLNLGARALAKASADPKGFKDWLRRRIEAAFRKLPHVPAWCATLEFTPAPQNRLHAHGLIVAHNHELSAIEAALNTAGTPWGKIKGQKHQVDTRVAWDRTGWSLYCTKASNRACKRLGVKSVLIASNQLRRQAHDEWERRRARLIRIGASVHSKTAAHRKTSPSEGSPIIAPSLDEREHAFGFAGRREEVRIERTRSHSCLRLVPVRVARERFEFHRNDGLLLPPNRP